MTQSIDSPVPSPSRRWQIGLALTILIVFLLSLILVNNTFNFNKIERALDNLQYKPIDSSSVTPAEMQELRHKINSIERFIRTTPLVECGNDIKR